MEKNHHKRLFFGILTGFLFMHLCVVNYVRILPLVDLPHHLAAATIIRYYGQPTNQFAQYYPFRLFPYANLFYLLFMGSPAFPSVTWAAKVFYSLYIILLPLSVFLLIRRLGGDVWLALLSFFFLYNADFCWGVSSFTFFIPVFFLFCLVLVKHMGEDRPGTHVLMLAMLLLIYFIHIIGALFSIGVTLAAVFCRRGVSRRTSFRKALPAAVMLLAILVLGGTLMASSPGTYWEDYAPRFSGINFGVRLRELLVFDNFFLFRPTAGDNIAFLFAAFVIGTAVVRYKISRRDRPEEAPAGRGIAPVLFLFPLLCFFFLPKHYLGNEFIYQRFSSLFFLGLIVAGSLAGPPASRSLKTVIVTLGALHLLLWAQCFVSFDRENRGFTRDLFPSATRDKVLTGLIFDKNFRRFPVYMHFPDYYIVWRQGIAATSMLRYGLVVFDNDFPRKPLPAYDEWVNGQSPLDEECLKADYLLVRGKIPPVYEDVIRTRFDLFRSSGLWSVFQRWP